MLPTRSRISYPQDEVQPRPIYMEKDFDKWNSLKKKINGFEGRAYAYPREIWWCSLGVNVGVEIDGKNDGYERPVIIIKVYNLEAMLVLPITGKEKNDKFHHKIKTNNKIVWVKLTQARVVSNKRLLRKVDILGEEEFVKLLKVWKDSV